MKFGEFIFKYKKADDGEKVELIKKNIKRKYVSYEMKSARCKAVAEGTMLEDDKIKMNTPARYMLLICVFILDHMDFELDGLTNVEFFNQLEETGADDMICTVLKSEFEKYRAILDMIVDDLLDEKRNYVDYIDRIAEGTIDVILALAKGMPKEEEKNGE